MKIFFCVVIAIFFSSMSYSQEMAFEKPTQGKEPAIVKREIADMLKYFQVSAKRAKFKTVLLDLDADGHKDALVLFESMDFCSASGSGGCSLFAFRCDAKKCRHWFTIQVVNRPVYISSNRTKGLPDFVAPLAGLANSGKFAVLKYDGKAYPVSPGDGVEMTEIEMKQQKLTQLY